MSGKGHYIVGTADGADFATITAAMEVVADGDIVSLQPGLYEQLIHIHADITLNVITNNMQTSQTENEIMNNNNISVVNTANGTSDHTDTNENTSSTKYKTNLSLLPQQQNQHQQKALRQSTTQQESSSYTHHTNHNVPLKQSTTNILHINEAVISNGVIINANATLQHLNITGRVDVRAGHACLMYCEVHHGKDGVRVWESAALTLQHSRIHHCTDDGDGLYFMPHATGTVDNCDIYECRVNGIHARHARVTLRDCRIRDCKFGVYFCDQASGLVQHNTIEHITRFGVYIVEQSEPVVQGNTISQCGIHTVMVSSGGMGLISDNTLKGSMHVCAGCPARLGENRVSGVCDVDPNTNTTNTINTSSSNYTMQMMTQAVHAK